jgi:oleate hydratase
VKNERKTIELTEDDLVFITNGGLRGVDSPMGSTRTRRPASIRTLKPGNGWDMWNRIAAVDPSFGHPEKFMLRPGTSPSG